MCKNNQDQLKPEAYTRLRGCSPLLCRFLVERLRLTATDHLLDLGSGPGENTALLAGLSKAMVEGVDIDPERVEFARISHPAVRFHHGNAEALAFQSGSFTVATMMLSAQRFGDRAKAFREVARILVSGGRVAIATVSPDQLAARPDFRVFPTALKMECERFPAISLLHQDLLQAGFTSIEDKPFSEVIRPLDATFLRWLEQYPFTVLRRIPPQEFRDGLNSIEQSIQACPGVQLLHDEYTVITAMKP